MGTPAYPEDFGTVLKSIVGRANAAFTAANSRKPLTVIEARAFTVRAPVTVTGDASSMVLFPGNTDDASPEIRMMPGTDPDNISSIRTVVFDDGVTAEAELIIESGADVTETFRTQFRAAGAQMGMASYTADLTENAGGGIGISPDLWQIGQFQAAGLVGGFAQGDSATATVGVNATAGGNTWFDFDGPSGQTRHSGKWPNFINNGTDTGLYTGESAAGSAGDTSFALSYGATMLSLLIPIPAIFDSVVHPQSVSAFSAAGFTAKWSTATAASYRIFFWCFRV